MEMSVGRKNERTVEREWDRCRGSEEQCIGIL